MRTAVLFAAVLSLAACGVKATSPDEPHLSVTRILAFGDSLTEGGATPSSVAPMFVHPTDDPGTTKGYPYKLLQLLTERYSTQTISVYNGGYSGRFLSDDATDTPDRTLTEFLDAFHPDVMILLHGTNDVNQVSPNIPAVAAYAGVLIDKALARGTKVILSSLPPRVQGGSPPRALDPSFVVAFNNALVGVAAQKNVPFVNVYTPITASLSGPDMAPDGLHLTQAGNDKLAAVYFSALRLLYETSK